MLSISEKKSLHYTASMLCSKKDYKEFTSLLETNPKFSIDENCDGKSWNLIHTAAYFDFTLGLEYLIKKGADLNIEEQNGISPLLLAVSSNSFSCVELLLNNNADLKKCDKNGYNPLMSACFNGNNEILNLLLPNIDEEYLYKKDKKGNTALDYAKIKDNKNVAVIMEKLKIENFLKLTEINNKKMKINKI